MEHEGRAGVHVHGGHCRRRRPRQHPSQACFEGGVIALLSPAIRVGLVTGSWLWTGVALACTAGLWLLVLLVRLSRR